jgi:hypothetical protein
VLYDMTKMPACLFHDFCVGEVFKQKYAAKGPSNNKLRHVTSAIKIIV